MGTLIGAVLGYVDPNLIQVSIPPLSGYVILGYLRITSVSSSKIVLNSFGCGKAYNNNTGKVVRIVLAWREG